MTESNQTEEVKEEIVIGITTTENPKVELEDEEKKIVFYCKECREIIENPHKMKTKYVYVCKKCNTKQVAFGNKHSIEYIYKVGNEELDETIEEKTMKTEAEKQNKSK